MPVGVQLKGQYLSPQASFTGSLNPVSIHQLSITYICWRMNTCSHQANKIYEQHYIISKLTNQFIKHLQKSNRFWTLHRYGLGLLSFSHKKRFSYIHGKIMVWFKICTLLRSGLMVKRNHIKGENVLYPSTIVLRMLGVVSRDKQ